MHLKELIEQYQLKAAKTVPEWMIGCFKRRSISFANGLSDPLTHVFWLQGRNLTIDLRLPQESEQVKKLDWQYCNEQEKYDLANYEGWSADTSWENEVLSWSGGTSFQLHNRWPEPGIMHRVGDCMMEFSPNDTYVEDWRLKSRASGPLVSLELIEEIDLNTKECRHRGGALIINGNWAGMVLGRSSALQNPQGFMQIRDLIKSDPLNHTLCAQVFNFETSVGQGDIESGFDIEYSTTALRVGKPLMSLDGFDFDDTNKEVIQTFAENGSLIQRRFSIDTLEPSFPYLVATQWPSESKQWFEKEQETLGRYLQILE